MLLFFLGGCGPKVPRPPQENFRGHIDIQVQNKSGELLERVSGIFKVEGEKNKLSMFFDNRSGIPIGYVVVQDGNIESEGLTFMREFNKIFKFWPYIFGIGISGSKSSYTYKDLEINYLQWRKIGSNNYAKKANVEIPAGIIAMDIKYDN
ncbi:MAG: hypothetical protein ACQEQC_03740 [Elusimicrobiota bacterium]